ncbi:MAG: BamA/TamA family outer membrane protein [bacterium]|nr:BamA/TamA family outer membrane protein [bacterium]
MRRFFLVLGVLASVVLSDTGLSAQDYFGMNKVTYQGYDWHYIETEHFIIYFDKNSQPVAEFAAKEAERSLVRIEKDLKYTLKDRYPMVIYNSHNGFSVTNISPYEQSEFTGGFTEFSQGRVVIPYTGSYADFRHVIHHELVHVVTIELWTGGGWLGSMLSQSATLPPLWIAEGIAEYLSQGGWDNEADNFMRYATISGFVPPIPALNGSFAYKGGQAVFMMIEETYGKDKVAEFISAFRSARTPDKAMKSSVGVGLEELSEAWQLWLKRQYWNEINLHNKSDEIAKELTDDDEMQGVYNIAPSFSPQGDKIAYVTERQGTFDIYLMSAIDGQDLGRLVEGERSSAFESMFVLRPGITWSPDGKQIAFAAKSKNKNTLYTMDVRKKKIKKRFRFDLDGLFEPTWSPDGKQIAVVGLKNGWSDIYVVDLETESLRRITSDPYDEKHLDWSPDGAWIAMSSDRPDTNLAYNGQKDFPFGQYDIYTIRSDGSEVRRVVQDEANDEHPTWGPDSQRLAFVSNRTGVANIYISHIDSAEVYPITNLLSSVQYIDWSADGKKIAFSTFHKQGYDIFVMKDPQSKRKKMEELPLTRYAKRLRGIEDKSFVELQREKQEEEKKVEAKADTVVLASEKSDSLVMDRKIEKWVSDQMALAAAEAAGPEEDDANVAGTDSTEKQDDRQVSLRDWDKEFQVKRYRVKLKPEFFGANAGFDTFYGVSGLVQLSLTDVMGDHRVVIQTGLSFSLKDSDLYLRYENLKHQTNYALEAMHTRSFFISGGEVFGDRLYGGGFSLERPFSRFSRIELSTQAISISREAIGVYDNPFVRGGYTGGVVRGSGQEISSNQAVISQFGLVVDNSLNSMVGPVDGRRARLGIEGSWAGMKYVSFNLDYRKYVLALNEYTFAFRLGGGTSYGPNRQVYFLGGVNNSINPNFATFAQVDQDRIFFSSYVWPLRGVELFEMAGDSYVLANFAFRFPLIRQLAMGWPLPFFFQNVQGELFLDVGSAFDRGDFDPWESKGGGFELRDLKAGYGLGVRVDAGMFLFRYDLAWPTDFAESGSPIQYFSIDYTGLF